MLMKFFVRIVQAYDSIVDALISQVNFTNISVVQLGIGLIGERVSITITYSRKVVIFIFVRT